VNRLTAVFTTVFAATFPFVAVAESGSTTYTQTLTEHEAALTITADADSGRGLAVDVDPRYPGAECFGGPGGSRNVKGESIQVRGGNNFAIWWDGDQLREILNRNTISKWNWETGEMGRIFTAEGCESNNGSKATPALSADLFGDWREELIERTSDNQELRIYATVIPTEHRIHTPMHDPQYRESIAWQNVAYNQPPHTGFFLGAGMKAAPKPNIRLVQKMGAGHNGSAVLVRRQPEDDNANCLLSAKWHRLLRHLHLWWGLPG